METTLISSGIYYDHTKLQDKYFFGGFFNLAQNNIDNVIKAFIIKFFPERKDKDINTFQFLDICFKDNDADSDFMKKIKFLKMHFPVVGYLSVDNDKAGFKRKFSLLLKAISELRNFYTHYYHKPLESSSELFELLDFIFVETTNEIKKLKKKDDKTQQLLSKNLSEEYKIRYQQQIDRLKELKAQGKRVQLNDETAIRNGVFNTAFNHLIYKDGESVKPSRFYQSSYYSETGAAENGIPFSQSSILFLLSLFLERKETEDLKSRVKGFKAKIIKQGEEQISSLKFMATHWVFSYLCFKGIKQKLSAEFHEETLLIQIIDELSKVPDEVYSAFDSKTKEKFVEDINEYMKEGNADLSLEDSKVIHPIIRKRYENKFNYFAIRFLDEFLSSTSLKFQVHVGNFVHDRRVKNINGTGFQTERVVKDRIKVFGRLSKISNLKADYIKEQLELPNNSNGWEIFPNPSYIFIDNNVPIHILTDESTKKGIELFKDKRRKEQPEELQKRKGKLSKHNIVEIMFKEAKGKDKLRIDEPIALLSLNEIPALLYQILEKNATPEDIELIVKNKLTERFEKIKNYDPEIPAPAAHISKRLRNNTTAKGQETLNSEKLSLLIEREIVNTETKLDCIEKKRREAKKEHRRNTFPSSIFSNSELGRIAAWLADDIKRFMPAELRKNWKGYQHSQLQQSLAYFEKRPQEAFLLLKEGWDTSDGSSYWNNWIINSFSETQFSEFYESYLKKRAKYFSELAENIKQHIHNTKFLRKFIKQQMPADLFPKRHYILKDLETEKNKILSKPLVFSRGLFDSNPTFIKGVKVTENPELFAEWYSYGYRTDHAFQHFYDWERDYNDLLDSELQKDNSFAKNSIHYSRESQLDLIKLKQDLKIKKIKIQDLFLKRIAEKLFENVFNYSTTLSLDEFYMTQEERAEKERIALAQSLREEGDSSPNIIKDDFIWSKTIAFRSKQIYEPAIKLKDIGKFNRFVLDDEKSKASKLLSYDKNKIWNKEQLEKELSIGENSYEVIRREKLFKEIQNLELLTLSNWPWDGINHPREFEMEVQKNAWHPNFKMYVVNGILRKNTNLYKEGEDFWLESLKENDFKTLPSEILETKSETVQLLFLVIMIRNQFAHNQLPEAQFYNFIRKNYPEIQNNTVSELYLNLIKLAVQKLKENN